MAALGAALIVLAGALHGCNARGGPDRVIVSGKVSYNGQPVHEGRLRFIPLAETTGPVSIAFIKDGSYSTADAGGVPVGHHRAEILAYDPAELASRQPGFGQPAPRQLLPAKYNKNSQLSVEIAAGGKQLVHDFDLER